MKLELPDEEINELQRRSIIKLVERAKHAHMININMRINAQDVVLEADWIKNLRFEQPNNLKAKIGSELYRAFDALGASPDLLAIIGSYGDTLDDQDVLGALLLYNKTGKALIEMRDTH